MEIFLQIEENNLMEAIKPFESQSIESLVIKYQKIFEELSGVIEKIKKKPFIFEKKARNQHGSYREDRFI